MNIQDVIRTKGGHEVVIWEVINGLAWGRVTYDIIRFATWEETGKVRFVYGIEPICPGAPNFLDLDLRDWKDEIPWECIREEVNWVYTHYDGGAWRASIEEPCEYNGFRDPANGRCFALGAIKMPPGPADWKEAIARRPE